MEKMAQKDAKDSYSGRFGNYFKDQAFATGGQEPMHLEDGAYAVLQRQFADFSLSDHKRRPSRNLRRRPIVSDLLKYSSVAEILPFILLHLLNMDANPFVFSVFLRGCLCFFVSVCLCWRMCLQSVSYNRTLKPISRGCLLLVRWRWMLAIILLWII